MPLRGSAPYEHCTTAAYHAFHYPLIDELVVKKLSVTGSMELPERSWRPEGSAATCRLCNLKVAGPSCS